MAKAGWIFRIEIITEKPATKTQEMIKHLKALFKDSELINESLIEELFEDIKLFKETKEEA